MIKPLQTGPMHNYLHCKIGFTKVAKKFHAFKNQKYPLQTTT
jgi:hypothetical protein